MWYYLPIRENAISQLRFLVNNMDFTEKELSVIERCELFTGFSGGTLGEALKFFKAEARHHQKGECLCGVGDTLLGFGLVLSGTVQVFTEDINGERVIMANVPAGATFGESLCYLSEKNSPVFVFAQTECSVLWMKCDNLKISGVENLILRERFISMLARRALSMNDRIQILSKLTLREKLLTYFSQCAKEQKSRTFSIPLDRESLAIYLGVNRSALSRELSKMQKDGLIEFYKNSFKIL